MWPIVEQKAQQFRELEAKLADPDITGNHLEFNKLNKEYGALAKLVKPYFEYVEISNAVKQSEELAASDDSEMKALADEELATLRPKLEVLKARIEVQLLVDPDDDFDRIILEIRAGTGGDEAAIFAGDLYEMYLRFARNKGWQAEEISSSPGEAGGFKEVVVGVRGEGVFTSLRYESGGHRVQRVPKTETQGRIHTSAATVAVLPEPDEVQVEILPADIE